MGRAMLIILSGVIVALGYMGIGATEQGKRIITKNVDYAEFVKAKNAAHTAIQISMQKMNEDSTWGETHHSGNSWKTTIDGSSTELYVEYIYDSPDFWNPDTLRMVSTAEYLDDEEVKVISVYVKNPFSFVPKFKSPLTIATPYYNMQSGGSASIDGYDGTGACADQPGVTVMNSTAAADVQSSTSSIDVDGDPTIDTDTTLSYQPTDKLIDRLEEMEGTKFLPEGTYKGELGTPENPGVFFVEHDTKLNSGSIKEGYGILVIRKSGFMSLQDSTSSTGTLDLAGNYTFNGLVIFENANVFDGTGTPTINGSVLVGHNLEDDPNPDPIDINIRGNLHLQGDCTAEDYANKAAALTIKQNQYKRLSTFE